MKLLGLILILISFAHAETVEESALRLRLSKDAEGPQLESVIRMATGTLSGVEPKVDCDDERRFVLIGVSGFGTGEDGKGQPSGVHDNLPSHERISSTLRITHGTSEKRLREIVNNICGGRTSTGVKPPGLMIMANSWGAGAATKLSRIYQETCGEPVELFVMVDGVKKPIGPHTKPPVAKRCINYYERRSTVRGNAIVGCENQDLSNTCSGGGMATCHIEVEWEGSSRGAREVLSALR